MPRPLVLITLAVALFTTWLVRSYLDAVLIAMVVSILVGPVHRRVVALVGGRRAVGTALTLGLLVVAVLVPLAVLSVVAGREVVGLANQMTARIEVTDWDQWISGLVGDLAGYGLADLAGGERALIDTAEKVVREGALSLASTLTRNAPNVLSVTTSVVLDGVVFLVATATLLARGPELQSFTLRISPLAPEHTNRLIEVFVEFARNVVLAGLVAGVLQGIVAGIGFWLADVDRWALFGLLTAVLAYVPLIGTSLVWVPVTVLLLSEGRTGAALFVVGWSLLLTGTVDNLVRPFIVQGRSDVPLLLVILGAFGGLATYGLIGLLVGPVQVAMLLALLHIYAEERRATG